MSPEHEHQFRELVAARSPALLRTAYLLTGDVHHAQDLLQTALLATARRWTRIRDRDQPEGYVRRATYRHQGLLAALRSLPARQRAVVVLRYYEDRSEAEVAADIIGGAVGWAADSRRYLALLAGAEDTDTVEPGALQYIEPDGSLGEVIEIEGGLVGGAESYSPSREYLIADAAGIMSAQPVPSKVVEVQTGVVAELPASDPVGWYDEITVALHVFDETTEEYSLQLVDIGSGTVTEMIDLSGLPTPGYASHPGVIQLGPSEGLTGALTSRIGRQHLLSRPRRS